MKRTSVIAAFAVLWLAGAPVAAQGPGDGPGSAIRAGADRMTIGSFRDSYTSLGFNSFNLAWDFVTRGEAGSFSAAYNRPVFTIGLTYNTLDDVVFRSERGHYSPMVAAYAGIGRDLLRYGPFSLGYDISLGLSYSDGYYDPLTNPSNWFFSSPVLFHAAGGGHITWQLARRLDLIADISVRHSSSARFAYPNGGLNYWGGGLSARYHFQDRKPAPSRGFRTPRISDELYEKGWSYEIYAGGGVHACAAEWLATSKTVDRETLAATHLRRWPMGSLGFDAIYRLNGRFALGANASAFYCSNMEALRWADGIIYSEEEAAASSYAPFSVGLGAVQEVFYRRTAFYLQEGYYLYRKAGIHADHGRLYERAGLRIYPRRIEPFFFSVCIKAHRFKADYMDFTIGLRFK
ncbi:MAG: acyloxyacyl hydrolase [Bacteroidales bacterium]|nr:acyloxyacyl hydrolase [Bacteroidales bacterium]